MIKLEMDEVAILLQIMMGSQYNGKDVIVVGKIVEKLQNELEKLQGKNWNG